MDLFRREFRRWGVPVQSNQLRDYYGLSHMDGKTRELFERHLARGVPIARLQKDRERLNTWMPPEELRGYRFAMGQLLIGKIGDRYIGYRDDRPIVLLAGTRSGKSSTILEPNLYLYSGSMLVLDPKGELARTAAFRRLMGHIVHVVDAFGQSGEQSSCFNPLAELDPTDEQIIDNVLAICRALVPETEGGGNAKHFNDSARTLLKGLILLVLTFPIEDRHLVTVRELLCLSYKPLADAARKIAEREMAKRSKGERIDYFDSSLVAVHLLMQKLIALGNRFGGVAAQVGRRFDQMSSVERSGVFSTASVHTDFVDSLAMRRILKRSDFRLRDLRGDVPMTIFLCLPVSHLEENYRYLRIVVQMMCFTLERMGLYPRDRPPILMMLEEWPTLGAMPIFEKAAAYFPSFGIQPLYVAQDLTQISRLYPSTYESFLGNAGLVQMFANGDKLTLEYATRKLGKLTVPWEQELTFARENESQLLLMKGRPPAAAMRLSHEDVERIRNRADDALRGY